MALIPGGAFAMGSSYNVPIPPFNLTEQPVHQVSIKPFALGVYAVTLEQWRQVSTLPQVGVSLHQLASAADGKLPVDIVSYAEANEFCQRLLASTGRKYRLPSEAEWEYACRAGTTTNYHFGDGISLQVANYNDGIVRPLGLTPVGSKNAPNRFGLHDMHGNVLEWCADSVYSSYDGAPADGSPWINPGDPLSRIARGGMYVWSAESARSAARDHNDIHATFSGGGFRVALDVASGLFDPGIGLAGLVNAASGLTFGLAPGEIIAIQGSHIGPTPAVSGALDDKGVFLTVLGGTRVLFDGVPAPLLYVSANQVNAVVPYKVAGQSSTQIVVEVQGQTSAPVSASVVKSCPALFTTDSSGKGQCAAVNQDGTLNSARNPAPKGSIITVFGTGEGQTNPPGVDGKLATAPLPAPLLPIGLLIGDVQAEIEYAGAAPEEIAGLLQINARVPSSIGSGRQTIFLRVDSTISQDGVFVVVG